MDQVLRQGRSLEETPSWSVATVTSVMVFVCFLVERAIYRFGKWLKKTRKKALSASLEKIKEELMLLGLISLMLGQWARWISEICVDSSIFSSRFYLCSEQDFGIHGNFLLRESVSPVNESVIPPRGLYNPSSHQCGEVLSSFIASCLFSVSPMFFTVV
ncbi:MLO-like protein 4 [Ancistrocladus abbreviatus]